MIKKYSMFILVLFWMGFIFYQGSRHLEVSYGNSDIFVDMVMLFVKAGEKLFHLTLNEVKIRGQVSYFIRKCAHFFEYGMLAAILTYSFNYLKCSKLNVIVYSLFITLLCAVLDEFYQSFVGRGSSVRDVMIDFSGAIVGVIFVLVVIPKILVQQGYEIKVEEITPSMILSSVKNYFRRN